MIKTIMIIFYLIFLLNVCNSKLIGRRPLSSIAYECSSNELINVDTNSYYSFAKNPKKMVNNLINQNYYFSKDKNKDKADYSSKKIISISPAGLKGFYSLGVALYIKENYDLTDVIYSGASAGSWISLYMAHTGDPLEIPYKLIDIDYDKISSVFELQINLKNMFLTSYNEDNFNMEKIFVGVTGVHNFQLVSNIYSQFDSLKDALDACVASSHIPLISGGLIAKYNDIISFDGGLSHYPYVNFSKPILHINPDMWKTEKRYLLDTCMEKDTMDLLNCYVGLRTSNLKNVSEMLQQGYSDTMQNHHILDSILPRK